MAATNFLFALRALKEAGVDFIVVGGVAAVLNGAPVNTFDLDIVYARNPENIARLLAAFESLDAIYRLQPARRLRPGATHLSSPGHQNLITAHGPLDVLGTINGGLTYENLLPHTTEMKTAPDLSVKVLNLETIVRLKTELGGEKDRAVLPILRRTLEQK